MIRTPWQNRKKHQRNISFLTGKRTIFFMDGNLIHRQEPMSLCLNEDFKPNSVVIKHVRFQQKCGCNITNLLAQALDIDKPTLEVTALIKICYMNSPFHRLRIPFWYFFSTRLLLSIFICLFYTHTSHCVFHIYYFHFTAECLCLVMLNNKPDYILIFFKFVFRFFVALCVLP